LARYHEGGHAVTALAFGIPVRSASIRPRKATFGRVITPRLPDKDVDIEIYIALAGPFAHRRFAPGSNWLTGDFAIAETQFDPPALSHTRSTRRRTGDRSHGRARPAVR